MLKRGYKSKLLSSEVIQNTCKIKQLFQLISDWFSSLVVIVMTHLHDLFLCVPVNELFILHIFFINTYNILARSIHILN